MISANELRIGNWVELAGRKEIIDGVLFQAYQDSRNIHLTGNGIWNYEEQISGIPLTPEILEKAGFDTDEITYWKEFSLEGQVLYIHLGYYKGKVFKYLPTNQISVQGVEVSFVHQLQNLYFALTGNELEIKL